VRNFKHPFVSPKLESSIRRLYEFVAETGEPVLRQLDFPRKSLPDRLAAIGFYRAVHEGFLRAQQELIELLLARQGSKDLDTRQEEATFRKLADAIAWQILGKQLYLGRRLYREQSPPTLRESNLASVIAAAHDIQGTDLGKFALISDLTSFVQVGDLLVSEPLDGRTTIVEVKTGKTNEKVLSFLVESWTDSRSPDDLELFKATEGKKAAEQAQRIARQMARLRHFSEIATTGKSDDPDTGYPVRIPEDVFYHDSYDAQMSTVIDKARTDDWAIQVIDGCLFVAAYANKMRRASNHAFEAWLREAEWRRGFPTSNLMNCMLSPLAFPIFMRDLPVEQKFDLLFGRVIVNFGLHLDTFIELGNRLGVQMRWSSRKHAATTGSGYGSLQVNNRVIVAERGEAEITVFDGIVTRIFFEGLATASAIRMLSATLDEMIRQESW